MKQLLPHQKNMIKRMEKLEKTNLIVKDEYILETKMGIYADPNGTGKTYAVLNLIKNDKMDWPIDKIYNKTKTTTKSGGLIKIQTLSKLTRLNTTIIVLSPYLIPNWEEELKTCDLNYIVINSKQDITSDTIFEKDIILVSVNFYNLLISTYPDCIWKRFIFDEPVNINVPRMSTVRAGYYWLITATPTQLRNISFSSQHMIRNVFNYYLESNTYKYLIVKNDLEYVKRSYTFPETTRIEHDCYQPLYNMCRNHTDTETADMISAGNILGAIRRLGGNETSNIFELIKQRLNNKIEDLKYSLSVATRQNNRNNIERYTGRIKSVEKQIAEIRGKYTERLDGECSICLGKLDKPVLITCCQNIMCGSCILQWNKNHNSCPLCRTATTPDSLIYIKNRNESPSNQPIVKRRLTKPETILEIINNNKDGKFMIFSNYSETFKNIYNVLQTNCISFKELKGQTTTRNKILKKFKEGNIKVLFLNSQSNGAGINLQEATDIILYHNLSQDLETQVIGRANRIGRKERLFVHQLN